MMMGTFHFFFFLDEEMIKYFFFAEKRLNFPKRDHEKCTFELNNEKGHLILIENKSFKHG